MRIARRNESIIGVFALLMSGLVFSDEILTREEMREEIPNFPRPLVCQFYTGPEDNRVLGEVFILSWATIVEIDSKTMTFRKDGVDYVVPAGSLYICNKLAG